MNDFRQKFRVTGYESPTHGFGYHVEVQDAPDGPWLSACDTLWSRMDTARDAALELADDCGGVVLP